MLRSYVRQAVWMGTASVLLTSSNAAHAFYWRDWPGSGTTPSQSTTTGATPGPGSVAVIPVPQPVPLPIQKTDPAVTDPQTSEPDPVIVTGDPGVDTPGSQVPEPSTLFLGFAGLGLCGVMRRLGVSLPTSGKMPLGISFDVAISRS